MWVRTYLELHPPQFGSSNWKKNKIKLISGLVVGYVFSFLSREGLNPAAIIIFMKKKIAGEF